MSHGFLSITLLCGLAGHLWAADLGETLARMDRASFAFRSVRAEVEKENYTAVIQDRAVESGRMWMLRSAKRSKGVRMRIEFAEPNLRSVAMAGKKAEIYYPKIKTVHEYDLGKHRKLVDQFLLLGFGTPGKELSKNYRLNLAGEEEIQGQQTTKLELTPKSKKAREQLIKVELWVADPSGYPVRQKFYWPSDDTTTITYSAIEMNVGVTESDLTLKLPADVKREFPQR
ncbi:MAG: outer membrane lipoprotein-sorting protein [bacterium]|nr:outer membrane lipoprotein-sorting protein [bacterium]